MSKYKVSIRRGLILIWMMQAIAVHADMFPIIPYPQEIRTTAGYLSPRLCHRIVVEQRDWAGVGVMLQRGLRERGQSLSIVHASSDNRPVIRLIREKMNVPTGHAEAYQLKIDARGVVIRAETPAGAFRGVQALLQLTDFSDRWPFLDIRDWPAFAWRGYMVDVGRNYMSVPMLKRQIDAMARYKLNVFHFHPTEDIAWRIEMKGYPVLTEARHMTRHAGKFYTREEIQDLIKYCNDRHILFVPEIDMPGHSAAFRRATGHDMQSDSGMTILKGILKEFMETYDLPYLHIGADEVRITNKRFIPEMTAFIRSYGRKVMGWEPGGDYDSATIRQLWREQPGKNSIDFKGPYVDSRHLYLNHHDPLESVVTIFNRRLCGKTVGDSMALGATLCLWHDRGVAEESELLKMNPVYPGMMAFAERSWRGGGKEGWVANISDGDLDAFVDFENRLLRHQAIYFSREPFPYWRQSQAAWMLFGPFDNKGDLRRMHVDTLQGPEQQGLKPFSRVRGGTVVLRHWWAPLIRGAVDSPRANTTVYAFRRIHARRDTFIHVWVGFNDLSRSMATDPPPVGAWDLKGSRVWVNGQRVAPPVWKRGGLKGDPEIPLVDEGYVYRTPVRIRLQKGWNNIWIQAPVGSFQASGWQNPVKWMFTFLEREGDLSE